MSVRANWFSDLEAEAGAEDIFACHATQLGLEIDLREPDALQQDLRRLLAEEAALYEKQVTCPIRDRADTSCAACPVRRSDPLDRLTPLCDVGVESERVMTTLAVHGVEQERPERGLTEG